MKEKVKQTMGGLRKSVRAAGVGLSTLAASFFMSVQAYAAGVEDSQIVTGTEQLIGDLTTWLMVLAPDCGGRGVLHRRRSWFRHSEPDPRLLSVSRGLFRSTGDSHALLNKSLHQ